jgi:hypothetical protein
MPRKSAQGIRWERCERQAMEGLDYWRLVDEFTVKQAALLTVGEDTGPTECYVDD